MTRMYACTTCDRVAVEYGAPPGWRLRLALILIAACAQVFAPMRSFGQLELPPPSPTISFVGGLLVPDSRFPNGQRIVNLQFTWTSGVGISGANWPANSTIPIHIVGPLNSPGVAAQDRLIGSVLSDSLGKIEPGIDYDPAVDIPYFDPISPSNVLHPGSYSLYGAYINPITHIGGGVYASKPINICPSTILQTIFTPFATTVDWSYARGGRNGNLGDNSPEQVDPEWLSVWDKLPISIYATVADTGSDGNNQPAFISHADWPGTHFGHDLNLDIVPDYAYQWILADGNFVGDLSASATARLEMEWETQNAGSPFTYGTGQIGVPLWATATAGDRVFVVGRWVMDNGHPDSGDRTEIHPVRALATMRKRNTAVPFGTLGAMTRAGQVDVYVSGHGGGANGFPDSLDTTLDNDGEGGGILRNILNDTALNVYERPGPASGAIADLFSAFFYLSGAPTIYSTAGPSAFGWSNGALVRPINDMDYDFDAPLPAAPAGAVNPRVAVITHPEHSTAVTELITYTNPDPTTGLPTTAHVHLPYKGADNGIYARTLLFSWDAFSPPGEHYQIQLLDVRPTSFSFNVTGLSQVPNNPGRWDLFADVCGQWYNLSNLSPSAFSSPKWGGTIGGLQGTKTDVYIDSGDTVRMFTQGYEVRDIDSLFGVDVGKTAYETGLDVVKALKLGSGENVDLGGALSVITPVKSPPPSYTKPADPVNYPFIFGGTHLTVPEPLYSIDYAMSFFPSPGRIQVTGAPVNFGPSCLGTDNINVIHVANPGESPLFILSLPISGAGFKLGTSASAVPIVLNAGQSVDIPVDFAPTATTQGQGSITINSTDLATPALSFALNGSVVNSSITASAATGRTPTLVVGTTTTWPVTIRNSGACALTVRPSITGAGFSLVLPALYINPLTGAIWKPIVVQPGETNTDLTVKFVTPFSAPKFTGTLTLSSNDPARPVTTLVFGAEGVPVGMRVLVVDAAGNPYPVVDDIQLKYNGDSKTNDHLKNVHVTLIDPPASWQRIEYHYMTALAPTSSGNTYELRVQVGNKKQTVNFSLSADEFKQLVITLP